MSHFQLPPLWVIVQLFWHLQHWLNIAEFWGVCKLVVLIVLFFQTPQKFIRASVFCMSFIYLFILKNVLAVDAPRNKQRKIVMKVLRSIREL